MSEDIAALIKAEQEHYDKVHAAEVAEDELVERVAVRVVELLDERMREKNLLTFKEHAAAITRHLGIDVPEVKP